MKLGNALFLLVSCFATLLNAQEWSTTQPRTIGVLLFPGFSVLDVFGMYLVRVSSFLLLGPLEFLDAISVFVPLRIITISEDGNPVPSKAKQVMGGGMDMSNHTMPSKNLSPEEQKRTMNMTNQGTSLESPDWPTNKLKAFQTVIADYSYANAPPFDIMLIAGGTGTRSQIRDGNITTFILDRAPSAELILTVCTGAGFLAKTGLLDGKRATSNKWAWKWVTMQGPNVNWVTEARWVQDGNIISSSGVAAGMDMIGKRSPLLSNFVVYFITKYYGESLANRICNVLEYEPHRNASWDPFAKVHGLINDTAPVVTPSQPSSGAYRSTRDLVGWFFISIFYALL